VLPASWLFLRAEILHMQAGQCGSQMGTRILEMVCDEHGIGCSGECFCDNDAQLGRINVFYHEVSGGKFVPRAVLMDLEPRQRDRRCSHKSPLGGLFRPKTS
jgi:tubulin beta